MCTLTNAKTALTANVVVPTQRPAIVGKLLCDDVTLGKMTTASCRDVDVMVAA